MDPTQDLIPEENNEQYPQAQRPVADTEAHVIFEATEEIRQDIDTTANPEEPETTIRAGDTTVLTQQETESAAPEVQQPDSAYSQEFPWNAPVFQQPQGQPAGPNGYIQQPLDPWQSQPAPQPQKQSPYANSPYVIDPAWQDRNRTQRKPKAKKQRDTKKFWKTVACAAVILTVIGGACFATAMVVGNSALRRMQAMEADFNSQMADLQQQIEDMEADQTVVIPGNSVSATGTGLTPAQVYAMNVRAVVMIRNQVTVNGQTGYSTGSGFILTEDGYVVTNHHVIEGAGKLAVITSDGQEYPAKLIGSDSTNDVALLKIEAQGLHAVTVGSSDDLVVGDQVVAIGNPLGELTSTLTVGYVSAKERDVNTDGFAINMLQTDAAINSGNSGGPLFNMYGQVVGITTAKYSGTSSSGASIEGVGFAIPIDDVSGLLSDLATYGYVTGAYMGVRVSDMEAAAASYYGLPMGAYVQDVDDGGAAQRAGIRGKDIIVKLGEYEIGNVNDLTRALRNFKGGDVTTVVVYRGGAEVTLTITLDEKPVPTT